MPEPIQSRAKLPLVQELLGQDGRQDGRVPEALGQPVWGVQCRGRQRAPGTAVGEEQQLRLTLDLHTDTVECVHHTHSHLHVELSTLLSTVPSFNVLYNRDS